MSTAPDLATPAIDTAARGRCAKVCARCGWLWLGGLFIVGAATLPYLGILHAPWVFDDFKLVRDNPLLRVEGEEAFERLTSMFAIDSREFDDAELRENYRPLRFLSYWVDYALARRFAPDFRPDDPPTFPFHVQNIVWHALNALLVACIGARLLSSRIGGFALGLLFAAHPLFTEAVTYISSRRDVLSTFFFLAATLVYLRSEPDRPLRWSSLVLTPVLFAPGFLAKEMVITLPAILFVLEIARRARLEWRRLTCHAALWGVAGWFIVVTTSNAGLIAAPVGGSASSTVLTASRYVMRYLGLALWPSDLTIDYSWDAIPPSTGLLSPASTLASMVAVVALAVLALFLTARRRAAPALGILWFLIGLTPVLQFVPIPERFAERFAYLPTIGVLLVAAWGIAALARRSPVASLALLAVVATPLLARTVSRNEDWRSRRRLWGQAVWVEPRCARAWLAYGNALKDERFWGDAIDAYDRALALWDEADPLTPLMEGQALQARMFRGGCHAVLAKSERSHLESAERDLRAVLASKDTDGKDVESSPEFVRIHHELASVLLEAGRPEEAKAEFRRIVEIGEPLAAVAQAHYWLGKIAIIERDLGRAVQSFRRVVDILPYDDPNLFSVAIELADTLSNLEGDHSRAWQILERVESLRPSDDIRVGILLRKARILDRQGELESCMERLREALAIDPGSIPVLLTLAGIEANQRDFASAEERYQRILRDDPWNEEAREAYKAIKVQQAVGGEKAKTEEEKNDEVLRGLVSRASKHFASDELLASREIWLQLLRTAGQLDRAEGVAIAYVGLARCEERLGRSQVALDNLLEAERVDPKRADTLLALASFHRRRGVEPATVRSYFFRYVRALADDDVPDPIAFSPWFRGEGHGGAALAEIERECGERDGRWREILDLQRGYVLADLGRWHEAYEVIDAYVAARPQADDEGRGIAILYLQEEVLPRMLEAEGTGGGETDDEEPTETSPTP